MESPAAIQKGLPVSLGQHAATRAALQDAVSRGRTPHHVQVRSAPRDSQAQLSTASQSTSARRAAHLSFAGLHAEELEYRADEGPEGWVPLRIVSPARAPGAAAQLRPLPVVIFLHATGWDKDSLAVHMAEYALAGYLTAAIDCRYHGERALPEDCHVDASNAYQDALCRAWRGSGEHPFLLDNVYDLQRLLDYLEARPDVDPRRIGVTGISLGGMHSWLLAAVDERVAAAAPMIGVQGFKWAVEQDQWQARAASIPQVFAAAARDMGKPAVDSQVVAAVWQRLLPGMLEMYDAPRSLACIAPRPMLIANGERDRRCPMAGVQPAVQAARTAYAEAGYPDNLELYEEAGLGHSCSSSMHAHVRRWLDRHLIESGPS